MDDTTDQREVLLGVEMERGESSSSIAYDQLPLAVAKPAPKETTKPTLNYDGDQNDVHTMPTSQVSVYLCCCCCVAPKDYKKKYFPEPRQCTNVIFAVLWSVCFLAGLCFFAYLAAAHSSEWSANFKKITKSTMTDQQRKNIIGLCAVCFSSSAVTIIGMFAFLKYQTHCAIRCSLACLWVAALSYGVWMVSVQKYFVGIMLLFLCMSIPLFFHLLRSKFSVTALLIRSASAVVWGRVSLLVCALVSVGFHVLWILMCGIVFIQLKSQGYEKSDKTYFANFLPLCTLLFFYYIWTAELIRYLMTYLTSSVVANWACFDSDDKEVRRAHLKERGFLAEWPTLAAIKYAFWHNLGVLALASLLVALIQTLRLFVRLLDRDGDGSCEQCLIDCILRCLEGQIRYMNNYAVTYSAIFGLGFLASSKQFMHQLQQRQGFQTVYNDDITAYVVLGSSLVVGSVTGILSGGLAWAVFGIIRIDQVVLVAFLFGLFAGLAALQVISAGVSALFVLYLYPETQIVFQSNHPQEYAVMRGAIEHSTGVELKEFQCLSGEGCCCPIVICI